MTKQKVSDKLVLSSKKKSQKKKIWIWDRNENVLRPFFFNIGRYDDRSWNR